MAETTPDGGGLSPEEQGILALRDTEQQEAEEEDHDEEEDESEREPDQQLQEEAEEHQAVTEEGVPNNEEQEDDEQENESPDNEENESPDNDMPDVEEPETQEVEEGETQNTEPDSQEGSSTPQLAQPEPTQPQTAQQQVRPQQQQPQPQQIEPYPMPRLIQALPPPQAQPRTPLPEPKTWKHLWDMDRERRAARGTQAYSQGPPQPGQQPYPGPPPYQQAQPFPGPVYTGQPPPGPPAYPGPIPPGHYYNATSQNLQPLPPPSPKQRGKKVPKADLSQPRPLYTILPAGWNPNTMPGPPPIGKRLLPPLSQTLAPPQPAAPPEPPQPKPPRAPARVYTDEQRQKVWDLHQQGFNHAEISAQADVTVTTIPSIIKRFKDRGGKLAPNPQGGRTRKMRECDFRHLMLLIERDPTLTARELKVLSGLDISVQTIERELQKREVERNPAKKRRKLLRAERDKAREEGRLVDEEEVEDEQDKEEEEQVPKTWGDLYRILDKSKPEPTKGRRKPGEAQSARKAFGYKN